MDLAPRYKLLTLLRLFKLLTLFTLLILATLFTLLALFTLLTLLTMFALLTLLPPPTLLIYCINSVGAKKKNGSSSSSLLSQSIKYIDIYIYVIVLWTSEQKTEVDGWTPLLCVL